MDFPDVTIRDLMEVGAHFGHKKSFWNPKMLPYIYGTSETKTHIIDLQKTVGMFRRALEFVCKIAAQGGRILFVGTKMQAADIVAEEAKRCSQYYINHRWLGGMLTNWKTVSSSISKISEYQNILKDDSEIYTKKELLGISRKLDKLEKSFGGISEVGGIPDVLFIIDVKKEKIAVKEANDLKIPIVGIVDTNSDPECINYPIPGNDDSTKSIKYYCRMISDAVLKGIEIELSSSSLGDVKNNDTKEENVS
ncbi:MAG: 30S ribosomal protein S2 [Rickettsiaceae bacterium H1]|nr:30S ribosomal protein S2 [Rickettsiaceae bacterium H1]